MGGKTVSQLDAATSLNLTDVLEISQSGASKKTTISEFSASLKTATELLSAQVTTTSTVITLANTPGIYNVVIPSAYMTANCATGVSAIVTVTTGTGATVIIPLCPKGDGLFSGNFYTSINIDSVGNCYSNYFNIIGANANGWWECDSNGNIKQYSIISGTATIGEAIIGVTLPKSCVDTNFIPTYSIEPLSHWNFYPKGTQTSGQTFNVFIQNTSPQQTVYVKWLVMGRWR